MAVIESEDRIAYITARARSVSFTRSILTVLTALFYWLGYGSAKVLTALWVAIVWCGVAVKLGWQEARPTGEDSARPRYPRT